MNGNVWKYISIGTCTLLSTILFVWISSVSGAQEDAAAATVANGEAIAILEENMRNIHYEQKIDRKILRRIDENTGGLGNAPDVRPLREK
jgi:hypothetical protein